MKETSTLEKLLLQYEVPDVLDAMIYGLGTYGSGWKVVVAFRKS